MVTKEEFLQWKNHAVTIELLETIKQKQEELSQFVLFGGTLGENAVQNTARAVGRNEVLQDLLDWYPIEEEDNEG